MKVNDTYHNTCNDQPSTWTITHIHDDGKVTVYSPQSDMNYTISQVIFEDTMKHLGFTLQTQQKITYVQGSSTWYIVYNHDVPLGDLSFIYAGGLYEKDCWVYSPEYGDPRQERKDFATIEEAKAYIEGKAEDEPAKYRIYFINHQYYHADSYQYINQAIEAGKETGMEFRVELGEMICCAWDVITGLRFYGEYQTWRQNQEYMLAKVEGSYP